jgi:transaldolase
MKIFVDTAKINEIEEAYSWGIVHGVTTNPSLIKRAVDDLRASGRSVDMEEYIGKICKTVGEGKPVSLEVISLTSERMVKEAKLLYKKFNPIAQNVVIKIPINTWTNGSKVTNYEGLKAISQLSKEGIPVNVTLVMNVGQAILAAKAGAHYVSPFAGRVDDYIRKGLGIGFQKGDYFDFQSVERVTSKKLDQKIGDGVDKPLATIYLDEDTKRVVTLGQDEGLYSGVELVRVIVKIFRNYGIKTEVIAASIRNPRQIREIAETGTDIATIPFKVLEEMLQHPKTVEGIKRFSEDVVPEYRELFSSN